MAANMPARPSVDSGFSLLVKDYTWCKRMDSFAKLPSDMPRFISLGLGYVGLPLAEAFVRAGYPVAGVDVDSHKVESLRSGHSYVGDVTDEQLASAIETGRLHFHTDYSALSEADIIIICVPTPLDKTKDPDISYILTAAEGVATHIRSGQLIILESTTYPGTTEEILFAPF